MASKSACYYSLVTITQFLLICTAENQICPEYLYQFGGSKADTGNLIRLGPAGAGTAAARLPYSETFFRKPTGRWSDGLLIPYFFAMALQLPLLNPYLERNASFDHGANFAVAGCTTLDSSFLAARGIQTPIINTPQCSTKLELIRLGAIRIVVPGNFPLGCFPIYLSKSNSTDPRLYDDLGCLRSLNELIVFQNNLLQKAIGSLRQEFPHVVIVYADYYSSFQSVLRRAPFLGFDKQSLLIACCGIGGTYNYDANRMCGSHDVPICPNPKQCIHWDGIHLTQEAHHHISDILKNILFEFQCVF
ncbi:Acetylajmalan esterase [Camellia lanceoleosa]|uniref:Acetylajmalan esterase n=1 Tax=Camellia lanceoleosa TaxID=1840588 RepID=A0ACC0G6I8_9ERIC|nr:Acetylajmalan esterase [Camellia lanceoleosa]